MTDNVHVYPTTEEHLTEGLDCWCSPRYGVPCDECEPGAASCWKCDGGLITVTRSQAEACPMRIVIVHNR